LMMSLPPSGPCAGPPRSAPINKGHPCNNGDAHHQQWQPEQLKQLERCRTRAPAGSPPAGHPATRTALEMAYTSHDMGCLPYRGACPCPSATC
jgi:hypothetical protein